MAEYHASNPGPDPYRNLSAEARAFFRCHDVIHVVYGCANALNDEAIVKLSSLYGSTAGLRVLKGYRLHESFQIYRSLRGADILLSVLCSVYITPRTLFRCLRQRRRWPWEGFETYLDAPLGEIRREFGIVVARRGPKTRPQSRTDQLGVGHGGGPP
ncbi:MAG: hypothetical protein ACOY17_04950 [Pseudomonadota bacterium]